ncbi:hypothetical protein G4B88_005382 [Cannabis sativa]|uniref:Homeobox domain-containing protein n=1 Tax=Cannabis sativa TaxID=3483 RepID=A0A7J6HAV6_CANSA|nr:hypothetical protein G4B88_005382 [Cannabis sativa]
MSPAPNSSSSSTSRWCPTPEQLMILEEMYRAGTRTPNASQIQQITAHLSFYGKIEGKNVFYWFQNHKARDRQKLRRKLYKQLQQQQHQHQLAAAAAYHNHNHNNTHHHQLITTTPPNDHNQYHHHFSSVPTTSSSASSAFLHQPLSFISPQLLSKKAPISFSSKI